MKNLVLNVEVNLPYNMNLTNYREVPGYKVLDIK